MNWEMIGAVGELVGAAVVAVSLFYLASQVRFANRLARAEAFRAAATKSAELTTALASDRTFRDAFHKIYVEQRGRADVEPDGRVALGLWFSAQLSLLEQVHKEIELGILPSNVYESWGATLFQLPYLRETWPYLRGNYSRDFVTHMERWLSSVHE